MSTIDGKALLDNDGRPVSIDTLNERAKAWHAAQERDWVAFYAAREQAIQRDHRLTVRRRAQLVRRLTSVRA